MKATGNRRSPALIAAAFFWVAAFGPSCSDGPQVLGTNSDLGGIKTVKKKKTAGDAELSDADKAESGALSDSNTVDHGYASGSGSGSAALPDSPIVYPSFDLNGKGACTCKGKVNTTIARIGTSLSKDTLNINMYQADIQLDGKGKGQKEATEKIQQNTGITAYARPNAAEIKALRESGFDYAGYAIFAKQVVKSRQGQTYTFDKPLPVFPWPALAARYKDLQTAGSKTWSANVTGFRSFAVTVTLSLVEASDDKVVVKFTTDIPSDSTWELYEDFPIPRESIYTINPQASIVTRIENTNYFFGNECGDSKEQIKMAYALCKRDSDGKVDQYPCDM